MAITVRKASVCSLIFFQLIQRRDELSREVDYNLVLIIPDVQLAALGFLQPILRLLSAHPDNRNWCIVFRHVNIITP